MLPVVCVLFASVLAGAVPLQDNANVVVPISRDCHTTVLLGSVLAVHAGWTSEGASYYLNDTWGRTGTTWTSFQDSISHPGPRDAHVAFALNSTSMLLFGGNGGGSALRSKAGNSGPSGVYADFYNDLWVATVKSNSGVSWRELPKAATLPSARVRPSAVGNGTHMVLFGGWPGPNSKGEYDTMLNDLWVYDVASETWTEHTPKLLERWPAERYFHTAVMRQNDGKMYVFGGYAIAKHDKIVYYNDVWAYDFTTAKFEEVKTSGTKPSARSMHTAVMSDDTMLMFGGANPTDGNLGDLWSLDMSTMVWKELTPSTGPDARNSATATMVDGKMIMYAGEGAGTDPDLWSYDPSTNAWTQLQ